MCIVFIKYAIIVDYAIREFAAANTLCAIFMLKKISCETKKYFVSHSL